MAAKKELLLRAPLQEKAQKKSHRKEFIQRDYREMKRERTRTKKESTKVRFQKRELQRKEPHREKIKQGVGDDRGLPTFTHIYMKKVILWMDSFNKYQQQINIKPKCTHLEEKGEENICDLNMKLID